MKPAPSRSASALVAVLSACIAGCSGDHATHGRKRYEAGDVHGAIEELQWALKANPNDLPSRLLLGRAQQRTGALFEAKVHFEELRKHPAMRKDASRGLAAILLREGRAEDAAKIVAEEIAAAPGDPDWLEARGLATLGQADTIQADMHKELAAEIGESHARWTIERLGRSRTFADDKAFDEWNRFSVWDMETKAGFRNAAAYLAGAARVRSLARAAQADFEAAVSHDPGKFRSHVELGVMAAGRDDYDAARAHLLAAIELDDRTLPDTETRIAASEQHVRAADVLSTFLAKAGRTDEVVTLLDAEFAAGMLAPSMEERLACAYLDAGQLDKAAHFADVLLEADSRSTWGSYAKGRVALAEGHPAEAIPHLNRAYDRARSHPVINAAFARALAASGRDEQAIDHYLLAIQGRPRDVDLTIETAGIMARLRGPLEASRFLEGRLQPAFPNPMSREHQLILDGVRKYWAEARIPVSTVTDARQALVAYPESVFARLAVAKAEHAAGLPTIANPRLQEIVTQFPGLAEGWILSAQVLTDLNRDEEAAKALKRAASLRPDDPNIAWLEGRIALKRGARDDARRAIKRALELDATNAGARLDLLELELAAKDHAAAAEHGRILMEAFPTDPRVLRGVGRARLAMNDARGAIDPLRRAVAALPDDYGLAVVFARALLKADASFADEARTNLVALAANREAPKAAREAAAVALDEASFHADAATAWADLYAFASSEEDRVAIAERGYWAYLDAGKPLAALDVLVRMRATNRRAEAGRLFVLAAERLGFKREAAAAAAVLRSENHHDAASLRAALRANLQCEFWARAIEDADDLARLWPATATEIAPERARALLGLGRITEAEQIANEAPADGPAALERRARLRLDLAIAKADAASIEAALSELLARAPKDVDARLAAVRTLMAVDQRAAAAQALASMPPGPLDNDGAVLAAGALIAASDPAAAAAMLDRATPGDDRTREMRGLVALLMGVQPDEKAASARMLWSVAARDWAGAAAYAGRIAEPKSIREQWLAIVSLIETAPDLALPSARDLAAARAYALARLGRQSDAILTTFATNAGPRRVCFDVLRAWWMVCRGEAKAAAPVIVPLMEGHGNHAGVVFVAAAAGWWNAGEGAAMKLLAAGSEPPPAAFVSDLVAFFAEVGEYSAAVRAYQRIEKPDDRERAIRFLIAIERRELAEARTLFEGLPAAMKAAAPFTAGRLWVAAQGDKTKQAATAEIKALASAGAAGPDAPDPVVLAEAAWLVQADAEATAVIWAELGRTAFAPEPMNRFAEILRRLGTGQATLAVIEDRLRVVDPGAKFSTLKPRPIRLAF